MEQLLEDVCGYINNFFVMKNGYHAGMYTVSDKKLNVDFLQNGQYFRIVGSVFNDGVWKYPASDLSDEQFTGEIWAMAVPPAVIALLADIDEWNSKYGTASSINMSPFSSESFNNYSYSKGTRGSGSEQSGSSPLTWKDVYGRMLTRWRKL